MKLSVVNQSGQAVPRVFLGRWAKALARHAAAEIAPKRFRGKELVLAFVDAKTARRLNREFRGRDYATDVLSFAPGEPATLGELVICPSVIARQAREHGLLVREELGYMVLHGFLHLLGYDHERSEREAKRMFEIQDRLFERLLAATVARKKTRRR